MHYTILLHNILGEVLLMKYDNNLENLCMLYAYNILAILCAL